MVIFDPSRGAMTEAQPMWICDTQPLCACLEADPDDLAAYCCECLQEDGVCVACREPMILVDCDSGARLTS